jgi:pimeloyl-ACP methyl ester carboxylesterase
MPTATSNGISLFYDTFGKPSDPAMLLVMGLGAQMTLWEPAFCEALAARGFHVIRFDNRDVGLSTKIEGGPEPDLAKAMAGDPSSASYTLWDMADDAAGLLDALGIVKAHIVGASMGGMIVQAIAIRHPGRVLSMTSIMSTTGDREVGQSKPEAMAALLSPPPASREEAIDLMVRTMQVIGSPGYPADEAELRKRTGEAYDRSNYSAGMARQLVAIIASGDRTGELKNVSVPTLVIHGEDDPLVTHSGGQATARAVPGAKLLTVPGMGHDIPAQLRDQFVEAIVENAREASAAATA